MLDYHKYYEQSLFGIHDTRYLITDFDVHCNSVICCGNVDSISIDPNLDYCYQWTREYTILDQLNGEILVGRSVERTDHSPVCDFCIY